MVIIIYCDDPPEPEALKRIGELIQEGIVAGYDEPPGYTWKTQEEE